MHTENIAPSGHRRQRQSLYGVLVYGLGMLLGTELAGWLNERYTTETTDPVTRKRIAVTDWRKFWLIPCIGVVVALAVFVAFFRVMNVAIRRPPAQKIIRRGGHSATG